MNDENIQSSNYQPFPSFDDWKQIEVSLLDVIESSRHFSDLKDSTDRSALDATLERAKRAAAVDTNAIEGIFQTDRGFTHTVATQVGAWEQQMAMKGKHVKPAFDDTLEGFEYVLDAVTGRTPISQQWIRNLHAVILRSQESHEVFTAVGVQNQALQKGEYKTQPNSPQRSDGSVHAYAPVEDTPAEMARFISELESKEFLAAEKVIQAAYAHYAFVCIHPFADGNGRVARALASVFLYKDPGVPLVIYQDQRRDYIHALEAADKNNPLLLIRFFAERVTDTINSIIVDLTTPIAGKSGSAKLSDALRPTRVLPELHDAAHRLQESLFTEIRSRLDEEGKRNGLEFLLQRIFIGSPFNLPEGYNAFPDSYCLTLAFNSNSPKQIFHPLSIVIAARDGKRASSDLVAATSIGYNFHAYGREVEPVVTESFRERVKIYADGIVDHFLTELAKKFQQN